MAKELIVPIHVETTHFGPYESHTVEFSDGTQYHMSRTAIQGARGVVLGEVFDEVTLPGGDYLEVPDASNNYPLLAQFEEAEAVQRGEVLY